MWARCLGHGGNTTCHHSMFNYIPDLNIGIVVMTNSQNAMRMYATVGLTALAEYLKEKGIAIEEPKAEQEYVDGNNERFVGKYATGIGVVDIKQNGQNELVTKVSKIPVKLCLCKDGFYQCKPVKAIHKLPVFKHSIESMRLKFASYSGESVIVFEQSGKYHKTKSVIGCRYEQTQITESFKTACGNYKVVNENFTDIKCKCQLKVDGDVLMLEVTALDVKLKSCLKVVDENLAVIQGFGRLSREIIRLQKKDDGDYLIFSGIVFKKVE